MESTYARWSRVRESDDPEAEVRATMVADLVPTGERRLRPREWVRESLPGQRGGRPDRTPPPVDTGVVDRTMLWPLLCALPQRERAVLVLRFHEELTAEETAELLGCSPARVRADAHDALVAVRTARDQRVAQHSQVVALRKAAELARIRYEGGVASYLEVLDAERQLFSAELGLSQTQLLELSSVVGLYRALGGSWEIEASD